MAKPTEGPYVLIWHGNETYPFPLSIETADGNYWIARDGNVSSKANARLLAKSWEMHEIICDFLMNLPNTEAKARALLAEIDGDSQ